MNDLEKLKELRAKVRKYQDTAEHYRALFAEDGTIDNWEQEQLDKLQATIDKVLKEIERRHQKLSSQDQMTNLYDTSREVLSDQFSSDDDIVDHKLIDPVPLEQLKTRSLDDFKLRAHTAYWTEYLLDYVMKRPDVSAEELVKELLKINKRGFKDKESLQYAIKHYDCSGSVITVNRSSDGFELTGFTNANEGTPIEFTIFMVAKGYIEVKIITPITIPEKKKGLQQLNGVAGGAATFVMKYSGFGKLGRALHNYMDGKDPWTGEEGSTSGLIVGGFTDLLTMGASAPAALTNQGLNMFQEALEQASPEILEEISGGRELIDIATSSNKTELIANMIQLGLVTPELYTKHFGE